MTKAININKRVAELSATLPKVETPYTETAYDEMYGEVEEFIGYNCRYNCYYGIADYSSEQSYNTCVLQSVGEYQVLRFHQVNTYMSGEGMRKYYENSAEHAHDDEWFETEEDPEEYYDELEIQDSFEYKQVWIDKFGNTETLHLHPSLVDDIGAYIKVESLQTWASMPNVRKAILDNVEEETSFCHTYNDEPTLEFYLSQSAEYLNTNEPEFFKAILAHGFSRQAIKFFKTFRIAHRHGWNFPTDYDSLRKYFSILDLLSIEGTLRDKNFLCAPEYICPTDINIMWDKMESKRKKLQEKRTLAEIKHKEQDFADNHSYLFGIEFDSKSFHYQSLDSVLAYYNEGNNMHHCIYKCAFFDKHHLLSLHIEDHEGNRVATCSIDVLSRTINQIQPMGNATGFLHTYGIEWQSTKDYKEIWNTIMARMHTFPDMSIKTSDSNFKMQIAI